MADERTTLDDLRGLIERNHEDSERQFKAINQRAEQQFNDINQRVERLENQREGHTDEQIIDIIDQRLQVFAETILPSVIEQAVTHALEIPLNRVGESIKASQNNRDAIRQVQDDLKPLLEIRDGIVFLKRFIVGAGSLGSAVLVIWVIAAGVTS